MKIPETLKIGGHTYRIKADQVLEGKTGELVYPKCEIRIDASLTQSLKEATLIHEIFHALNSTLGDNMITHALQDSLSEQLYQVIKDNESALF